MNVKSCTLLCTGFLLLVSGTVFCQKQIIPEIQRQPLAARQLSMSYKGKMPEELYINNLSQKVLSWPYLAVLPQGTYLIIARSRGHAEFRTELVLNTDKQLEIALLADAPKTFALSVSSNAPNTRIFLNNNLLGEAGTSLQVPEGPCTLTFQASGYKDISQSIIMNGAKSLAITMEQSGYRLSISSDVKGTEIFLDGKRIGTDSVSVAVSAGSYRISVRAEGYSEQIIPTVVQGNQSIVVELKKPSGTLRLTTAFTNALKVFVDDIPYSGTQWTLSPGKHKVMIQSQGLEATATIEIIAGQTLTINPILNLQIQ